MNMMNTLIPVWIIGGPFVAMVILAFAFKGPSAMGGSVPRMPPRSRNALDDRSVDPGAPLLDPMHPGAPRRTV